MSFTNIVTPEWLSVHLADPAVKILDCTTYMLAQPVGPSKIESGRAQYVKGHIPGAQHVCMEQDFSEPGARFAFTVPSPDTFNRYDNSMNEWANTPDKPVQTGLAS